MKEVLKRVLSVMASIPTDKLLHFFYGSIIATPLVIWGTTMEAVGFMIFVSILKGIVDAKMRFSTPLEEISYATSLTPTYASVRTRLQNNVLDALFTFLPVLLLLAVKLV